MEKWQKYYMGITGIIFAISAIATFIFKAYISCFSAETVENIKMILVSIFVLIEVAMLVYFVVFSILFIKQGFQDSQKCNDELFKDIDQYKKYKKNGVKDKQYYTRQIQIINLYYEKGGKVNELVKNKEIERLYARADFLCVQNSCFKPLKALLSSLVISVVSQCIYKTLDGESASLTVLWVIVIVITFFWIYLLIQIVRRQGKSYRHYIDEYERKLLSQKIAELEQALTISVDDEQILEMQQMVITELIRMRKKGKSIRQRREVGRDIECVGQLNLCMGDYSKCYIKKIDVNGVVYYLVYDLEKGKENEHIGELNLINQEYVTLYQILNKYGLIP